MSQIVEGYPGEPRVLKERPPGAVNKVVAADWGSSSGCKDPLYATVSLFVLLQGPLCEIYVIPLEAEQLPLPHPCSHGKHVKGFKFLPLCGLKESPHLLCA